MCILPNLIKSRDFILKILGSGIQSKSGIPQRHNPHPHTFSQMVKVWNHLLFNPPLQSVYFKLIPSSRIGGLLKKLNWKAFKISLDVIAYISKQSIEHNATKLGELEVFNNKWVCWFVLGGCIWLMWASRGNWVLARLDTNSNPIHHLFTRLAKTLMPIADVDDFWGE